MGILIKISLEQKWNILFSVLFMAPDKACTTEIIEPQNILKLRSYRILYSNIHRCDLCFLVIVPSF
jgi:hypothetical protein